jgi:hypothetical protein
MDEDLPISLPKNGYVPPIFNTDNMYATFGPDATKLVKKTVALPDQNRVIRQNTSQMDSSSSAIEEYDSVLRNVRVNHSIWN